MPIKIGHASIDENGRTKNGQAGDQTNKEICIRSWYSKPWSFVLRCKDSSKAELMAAACENGCNNRYIGYDQNQRNTLRKEAQKVNYDLSRITTPCECDCSSFMTVCAEAAGINIPYTGTNAPTTSTMRAAFTSTGMFEVFADSKYIIDDTYLKRGDILVKPGCHTVMALENGSAVSNGSSSITTSMICIDVSAYQGSINWNQVKENGINYAILRGVTKNGLLDTTFDINYTNAGKSGITVLGAYHFSYALNELTAAKDAGNMVSKLNGKKVNIYLDLEWSEQRKLGKEKVTSIAKTYVNTCKSLGYTCHIYSNLDWYKNVYNPKELSILGCEFWIARYPSADTGEIKEHLKPNVGECIWQYSSKGRVSGINNHVDMNVIYKIPDNFNNNNSGSNDSSIHSVELLGEITASPSLKIRSGASTSYSQVGSYAKGVVVHIIGQTSNGWYQTDKGYISNKYVKQLIGQVYNCGGLNVRTTPDSGINNIITSMKPFDEAALLFDNGSWYKCKLNNGTIGWVSKKYIRIL